MHRGLERVGDTYRNTTRCLVRRKVRRSARHSLLTAVVAAPQHNPARARDAASDECGRLPDELCEVARGSRECRLGEIVHVDLVVPHLCHLLDRVGVLLALALIERDRVPHGEHEKGDILPQLLSVLQHQVRGRLGGAVRVRHGALALGGQHVAPCLGFVRRLVVPLERGHLVHFAEPVLGWRAREGGGVGSEGSERGVAQPDNARVGEYEVWVRKGNGRSEAIRV